MEIDKSRDDDLLLQEKGPDLRRYLKTLFTHRWMIVATTAVITAIAIAIIANIPSRYQAVASLVFELDQANLVSVEEIYDLGNQRREYILTQTQMLQSRQLAERVIQRLSLSENPEFSPGQVGTTMGMIFSFSGSEADDPGTTDSGEIDAITTTFLKRLTIEPVRNTNIVRVKFEAQSPVLAAQIANTLVEEFIAEQSEAKVQFTSRATSWLTERLETLRSKLEASENQLQNFREREDLIDLSGVRSLAERDLNEMTAQLQEMRRELKQISSIHDQFTTAEGDEMALANLPEVISNPLIQEIKRNVAVAERRRADLSRRYGAKHPLMIAATNEVRLVREQLANEMRNLSDAVENQYLTALSRVRDQENEVERAKENYQEVSQKDFRYQELVREVDVNRKLYDTFFTRVNETRETSGFDIAPAKLVDAAVIPNKPVKPNKKMLAAMSLALALAISVGIALVLDLLRTGVRGPEDVEDYLGQRLIGLIPDVSKISGTTLGLRTIFDPEQHVFGEAIRTLRTGVVLSSLGQSQRVIMVTSSVPAEGKTTTSENLAFSLAQVGKVLLIDADLRKPAVGIDFKIPREHPGLTDAITEAHPIEDCIVHDKVSGLDIMPSGNYCSDPQKVLVSFRFSETIAQLLRTYDRIIIDTPPVQAVSDALLISRSSDSLLYVVKCDSTNKRIVKKGINRFTQINASIDGVVLTHVDTRKGAVYEDEYYGYDFDKGVRQSSYSSNSGDDKPSGSPEQRKEPEIS